MTQENKQLYIEKMQAKAIAYVKNITSNIKKLMSEDEHQECIKDFAQAFLCGADAAWETIKELKNEEQQ